jgi:hypothetical protein
MDEDGWQPARLIPISGITGADEQERRGSSAFLAVLSSVKEFGKAITGPLGAPVGLMQTFIEVPFSLGEREVRPDGLIRITRGRQTWTALVEVKTGRNDLQSAQIEAYLDVAREHHFDVLLTISNQLVTVPGEHPTSVDKKKLRKVSLRHLSWSQIHTEAVIERVNRSVADPDQAWILDELIRYLEHQRSGAVDFDDMGPSWVSVRNATANRTLRTNDPAAAEVVGRFGQLVAFAGMRLSRSLGVDVRSALTRAEMSDLGILTQKGVTRLVESGILHGALRVPNAVAPIEVTADLRSGLITCSVTIDAPALARSTTRVTWLTRQLPKAPDALLLVAWSAFARSPGPAHPLTTVRENPSVLIEDPKKELRSFAISLTAVAGTKRGQGRGSFVGSVLALVDNFYEDVVQHIKPWSPPAPSVRTRLSTEDIGSGDDGISGELPLKSVQRSASPPEWPTQELDAHEATTTGDLRFVTPAEAVETSGGGDHDEAADTFQSDASPEAMPSESETGGNPHRN